MPKSSKSKFYKTLGASSRRALISHDQLDEYKNRGLISEKGKFNIPVIKPEFQNKEFDLTPWIVPIPLPEEK